MSIDKLGDCSCVTKGLLQMSNQMVNCLVKWLSVECEVALTELHQLVIQTVEIFMNHSFTERLNAKCMCVNTFICHSFILCVLWHIYWWLDDCMSASSCFSFGYFPVLLLSISAYFVVFFILRAKQLCMTQITRSTGTMRTSTKTCLGWWRDEWRHSCYGNLLVHALHCSVTQRSRLIPLSISHI